MCDYCQHARDRATYTFCGAETHDELYFPPMPTLRSRYSDDVYSLHWKNWLDVDSDSYWTLTNREVKSVLPVYACPMCGRNLPQTCIAEEAC